MVDGMVMKEIEDSTLLLGVDLSVLNLDSIHLPPSETHRIISNDEEFYQEDNLEFESGVGNIIIVDNLFIVPRKKFEKLEGSWYEAIFASPRIIFSSPSEHFLFTEAILLCKSSSPPHGFTFS
ncbi:hypothetical protein V8G54_016541 [Vigna mungo]|uniref:Uncharacterized protein n=1 Tax=Vigna mungo TaxID=3915 RepID=A0AAQ3NLC1_VIGMU